MKANTAQLRLGEYEFACGESIPSLEVAYATYGKYDGSNAILVCHALTGSHHVAGESELATAGQARAWWDDAVGPGAAIDTDRYFVICVNVPGSCYGTTGPASVNPATGEPYGPNFPPVTVTDWVRVQRRVLDHLGVDSLHAVVGGSVGGMNVLAWLREYPTFVERAIPIAGAPRLDPQSLALDAIARRAIMSDPAWNGGAYYSNEPPRRGLALARQIGHVMYLSKASMERKFGREPAQRDHDRRPFPTDPTSDHFPYLDVESYLDYQAGGFVERFDANAYLYLMNAMDHFDLAAGFDADAAALEAFDGEALVLSFTADWHFTVEQANALTAAFTAAGVDVQHRIIESDHGHDAFLVEVTAFEDILRDFLAEGVAGLGTSHPDTAQSSSESTSL